MRLTLYDINSLPPVVGAEVICEVLSISLPTFEGMLKRGDFPPPLATGTRTRKWNRDDLAMILNRGMLLGQTPTEEGRDLIEDLASVQRLVESLITKYGGPNG